MTEAEWLAATEPEPMLEYLRGKVSERKLRLFACGCCRRVWHLLTNEDSRAAVEVAERFADALVPKRHLSAARSRARRVASSPNGAYYIAWQATSAKLPSVVDTLARRTILCSAAYPASNDVKPGSAFMKLLRELFVNYPFRRVTIDPSSSDVEKESVVVASLLHDIFGNPFQPVPLNPSWLTSTVLALAKGIYDEKAFDRMPILADALQDADCENEEVLKHCREQKEHVRGCWVVDLLTGRK